jgi:mannose/fructose/N-acetylgalactosamine-specific phosphotransferase system component IID
MTTFPLPRRKPWWASVWPTLLAYAGTVSVCLGGYVALSLADPQASNRERLEALSTGLLGPLAGGSLLNSLMVAAPAALAIGAGLAFPRNVFTRLVGALALALWFALGLHASLTLQ